MTKKLKQRKLAMMTASPKPKKRKPAMMTAARKPRAKSPAKPVPTKEELAAYFRKQWAKEAPEVKKVVLEGAAADMERPMQPLTKQQLRAMRRHTEDWLKSFSRPKT